MLGSPSSRRSSRRLVDDAVVVHDVHIALDEESDFLSFKPPLRAAIFDDAHAP